MTPGISIIPPMIVKSPFGILRKIYGCNQQNKNLQKIVGEFCFCYQFECGEK